MAKFRVYEIAKKYNKDNKEILEILKANHVEVKNHMSTIGDEQIKMIENALKPKKEAKQDHNSKKQENSKRKDNSTGHAGVWINKLNSKKKFMAELFLSGKRVHYSSHYTLEEAIAARKSTEQIYGFHPNHGMDKPTESSTTIKSIP